MSELICVTNRNLCNRDFLKRIEELAQNGIDAVILREKDLTETEYEKLAGQVMEICRHHHVRCILHNFPNVALRLGAKAIHLPLPVLRTLSADVKAHFDCIGASCHSPEDAGEAQNLGCTYITAGHVFVTDCKKGVPPRGIPFLKEVCEQVSIPVYAIGGINKKIYLYLKRQVQKEAAS